MTVQSMQHSGTYGDHLPLQRTSTIFNVQLMIVSTLGVDATAILSPHGHYDESLPLLILGHFAEGCGDHHVSLDGPFRPFIRRIQRAEKQRVLLYNTGSDAVPDSDHHSNPDSDHHSDPNNYPPGDSSDVLHGDSCDVPYGDPNDVLHGDLHTVRYTDPDTVPSACPTVPKHIFPADPDFIASPNLPLIVLSTIIQYCLLMDMTMLGTFNRVSNLFRELTLPFLPKKIMRDSLVECLNIVTDEDCSISICRLYKAAGRNNGLASNIRQLFSQYARWITAWIVIRHISFGWFHIKDIHWKK